MGALTARAGASAASNSTGATATIRRDPIVAASAPVSGWATSMPAGAPSSASPSVPGPMSSFSWIAGRRAYQDTKTIPLRKKIAVTAARAREAVCATPLWYYKAAPSAPPVPNPCDAARPR